MQFLKTLEATFVGMLVATYGQSRPGIDMILVSPIGSLIYYETGYFTVRTSLSSSDQNPVSVT